ncbi:MAG: preprotein translocase subunit SecG [Candidatus Magasanikbacteria bacterium]
MLNILQVVVSVVLIILILLQERSSGLSGAFGGSSGTPYQKRRGLEKFIHWGTIVTAILFALLAVLNLII